MMDTITQVDQQVPELKERIVNGLRDAVMLTDVSGKILDVNPAFERLYGYHKEEIIGGEASVLKSGRHDITFFHHMWQSIRRGMTWEGNIYNKRKDGSILLVEETITPLFDSNGQVEYFLATMRENIMHGWQSEKGHKVLARNNSMTATLAHDLNNMVTPLQEVAEAAREKVGIDDPPVAELDRILQISDRAKELLRQVLVFCRHEQRDRHTPLSLVHIVKDVVHILKSDLPDTIKIETEFRQTNGVIPGEQVLLHQLLMNLCNNSLKAMKTTGGTLTILLENVVVNTNSPYLGELADGSYLKLSVTDDGIGMSPDSIRRAFDPFYSTRQDKAAGEGHGLGLSLVREIVEKHQGKVFLKSSESAGCTVDVFLPSGLENGGTETQMVPVDIVPVETGKILLVDSEHSIRQMGKNMLEFAGYHVTGMPGGEQAIGWFRQNHEGCDLIITEQVLPGIKGSKLAREIRNIRPDIPIIFISGVADKFPDDLMETLGRCHILHKPFSSDELLKAVWDFLKE